jgi:hypothetical protein
MLGIAAYTGIAGIVMLATAAVGLVGWGSDTVSVSYHAGMDLFFLFVGPSGLGITTIRQIVEGFGVLLVAVGGVTILATWLLPIHYLHGPIEITCLIVGIASVLSARYLPDRRRARGKLLR